MNNDKVLKEKLNSLDTLSSGIVFGKEEAWDKLQARMDKPAKRIALRPWLAAAAVLLLLVTVITAYYNMPEEQKIVKQVQHPIMDAPKPQAIPLPVVKVIENSGTTIRTPVKEKKHERPVTQEQEKQIIQTKHIQIVEAIPGSAPVDEVVAISNTPLALPSKIPVKVVHINEIGKEPHDPLPSVATDYTHINIQKLQVVHLNDFTKQQDLLNEYRYQQKDNIVISVPLFNPSIRYNQEYYSQENYTQGNYNPHNLLKFRIN